MKQITIYDLLPLLNDGYVAMDVNGNWWWYQTKPVAYKRRNCWMVKNARYMKLSTIETKDIAPFDGDWKDSLIKVEHKEEGGRMTKTLTEQWREGTLEQRYYYVKYFGNGQKPFVEIELKNFLLDLVKVKDRDKIEVLYAVPSYEEYQDIIQQNVNQEAAIETYIEQIKQLQKQLQEANAIITGEIHLVRRKDNEYVCESPEIINYKKKWGVK